jgi:tetratricopeptide (TPR) repeat protein/CHAT domain-containing protein
VWVGLWLAPARAQEQPPELDAIYQRGFKLYQAGKYAEAIPIAEEYISAAEAKYGKEHPLYATGLWYLGILYDALGRPSEAEPLFQRTLAIKEKTLGPDHIEVSDALYGLAESYRKQGRLAEAEPLYKRTLGIIEKHAVPDHYGISKIFEGLGELYLTQGRYAEAEPLLKRSLAIREKVLGPEHHEVAESVRKLGRLYSATERYDEARAALKRSNEITEKVLGPENKHLIDQSVKELADLNLQIMALNKAGKHEEAVPLAERFVAVREARYAAEGSAANASSYAAALNNLAETYHQLGRYSDAASLIARSLAIREKIQGPDHPDVASVLNNLAQLYSDLGRHSEAEPLYKRALAIDERLGPDTPSVSLVLDNLAMLLHAQGRYSEAEPLFKRSLAIRERTLGLNDPAVGRSLNNLAQLYRSQGRYADAKVLYDRALVITLRSMGDEHPDVAAVLHNLGSLEMSRGQFQSSEGYLRRALAITEKARGPEHTDVALTLNSLAELYRVMGRASEAQPLYERAIAILEKMLGPNHPNVAKAHNDLALLLDSQGRYAEAEQHFKRALTITEASLGPESPELITTLENLAAFHFEQRQWAKSYDYLLKSTQLKIQRAKRGTDDSALSEKRDRFSFLVKIAHQLAKIDTAQPLPLMYDVFETAQWAQNSEAALSLAQMAVRQGIGGSAAAQLVRERQDLVGEWRALDKVLLAARSTPPDKRNATSEASLSTRLSGIDGRIAEIDKRMATEFPEYSVLLRPEPLTIKEAQQYLSANEALVLFLDTPAGRSLNEETFIWVVTKGDMRWVKSELGTKALNERVAALRCGLDAALWDDEPAAARCSDLVKAAPERDAFDNIRAETLPFDANGAYALYKALFGPIEDVLKDKHLLLVPSGALTQLPFQVLITDKPDPALSGTEALRRAQWLVRSHALTVLPSVSSLKALRQFARNSHSSRTLIGFGNPLLDGPDARYVTLAAAARFKTSCPELPKHRIAALTGKRRGVLPLSLRSGVADVREIRSQVPLPETADELCAVAHDLGTSEKDIWLGDRATETEIKRLSEVGELAKYRIIHFATHGALAGQVGGNSEPGLILTPPATASERDDGYLSASEIVGLKLDADWVILSACNTAAGSAEGAEPLSGLARAFFYAGARALLVSHWAVASDVTVKLITGAVGRMASDKSIGRAEAMRQSMLALIDKGEPLEAHPAYWAPFVVVGEGRGEASALSTSSIISGPDAQPVAKTVGKANASPNKKLTPSDWKTEIWRR